MKRILISLIFLVAFIPQAISQDQDANVHVNADQETDFSQYKTFYWSPALDGTEEDKARSMDTLEVAKMKEMIAKKMEDMGYMLQEENPDLSVNFYIMTQDTANTTKEPEFPELGYSFWWGPDWYDRGDYWNGWDFWVNGETHWFYGNPTFDTRQGVGGETPAAGQGTLFIDIIDNKKNMLVWEGYITNANEGQEENGKNIEEGVSALLDEFPAEDEDQG